MILNNTSLLSGIKVIELTTMITGPLTGMLLADLGADVIKIENPDGGDPFRSFRGGQYSPHFCAYNRNKRSVVLDLRSEQGKQALEKLIKASDVLIENFRPGVMDRLGFHDEKLQALNGRLIHCHISGFGDGGPYSNRPAYDAVAQSLSGMSSLFLDPESPQITGPTISDNISGYYASQGILAALFQREKTSAGRRIDVNMLEATLAFMPDPFGYYTQMDIVSDPKLRARTSQSYAFQCSDGKLLTVHLSSQEKFWEQFVDVIARPDLLTHPKSSSRALRIDNYDFVKEVAAGIFAQHPRSHWLEVLAKRDIPFAPVYDVVEVLADPHIQHMGTFSTLTHPQMGALTAIRRPVLFDKSRDDQPQNSPPMLGEHTQEVLRTLK
jgi:formyl-CoA transferase